MSLRGGEATRVWCCTARQVAVRLNDGNRAYCTQSTASSYVRLTATMLSVAHVAMTATTVAPLGPVNFWMLMSADQKEKGHLTALRDGIFNPEADEASAQQCVLDADQTSVAIELSEEPDWWTRVTSGEGT